VDGTKTVMGDDGNAAPVTFTKPAPRAAMLYVMLYVVGLLTVDV
jgi:hypothetical protein